MIIKKIMAILAAACISMAVFTGCGDDDKKDDEKDKTSSSDKLSDDNAAADENDDDDNNDKNIDIDDNDGGNDDDGDSNSELVGKWETVELSDPTSDMVMKGDASFNGKPVAMMMQMELYDDGTCDFYSTDITSGDNLEVSGNWEFNGDTVTITNNNNDNSAELTLKNGQLIIETDEMKMTLGKVAKFTKETGDGDSDDGDDSFDGSVIGKWEIKSMAMSDGSGSFGGDNVINGVSVKLYFQIELYSDGTCDLYSMGTVQGSGTWELNGDTVTIDIEGDKMDFTLSNGLLKGSFTSSKGNSAAITMIKVNKFSK